MVLPPVSEWVGPWPTWQGLTRVTWGSAHFKRPLSHLKNPHEVTIKSPVHHHEIPLNAITSHVVTIKSPWNHHEIPSNTITIQPPFLINPPKSLGSSFNSTSGLRLAVHPLLQSLSFHGNSQKFVKIPWDSMAIHRDSTRWILPHGVISHMENPARQAATLTFTDQNRPV